MSTNSSKALSRCNISLTGDEAELISKLKIAIDNKKLGLKTTQASIVRMALNKLAEIENI